MDIAQHMIEQADWLHRVNGPPGVTNTLRDGAAEIARLRAELEEALSALDDATDLLVLAEHAWETEDYKKQSRVNEVYSRLAARAEGRS